MKMLAVCMCSISSYRKQIRVVSSLKSGILELFPSRYFILTRSSMNCMINQRRKIVSHVLPSPHVNSVTKFRSLELVYICYTILHCLLSISDIGGSSDHVNLLGHFSLQSGV